MIVHRRARVKRSTNEKKIRSYVTGKKTLSLDNFDRLEITRPFCFEVLDNVEAVLDTLFRLARDKVRETAPHRDSRGTGHGIVDPRDRDRLRQEFGTPGDSKVE